MVGEASISLATACYGKGINGNSGHDQDDVLYIAFTGASAVPGASGANWGASNYAAFQSSIEGLGNQLIAKIGSGGGSPGKPPVEETCEWVGHCAGASCKTYNDCSGVLECVKGICTA
jgi:hypothetical protein